MVVFFRFAVPQDKTIKRGDGAEPYLTIRELAGILRLSEQTIQRYVLKREIPCLKIRKVIRFRPADIEAWVQTAIRAEREAAGLVVSDGGKSERQQGEINFTPEFDGL